MLFRIVLSLTLLDVCLLGVEGMKYNITSFAKTKVPENVSEKCAASLDNPNGPMNSCAQNVEKNYRDEIKRKTPSFGNDVKKFRQFLIDEVCCMYVDGFQCIDKGVDVRFLKYIKIIFFQLFNYTSQNLYNFYDS